MALCRHACRRVHRYDGSTSSIAGYVWISDAILSQSFTDFLVVQRRFGSNVPGPLEARRRLAKRRNADLAAAGRGGGIDPSVLFDWKPIGQRKSAESPFASFVLDPEQSFNLPPRFDIPPPIATPEPTQTWSLLNITSRLTTPTPSQMLMEELPKTTSLEDIRTLVSNAGVDLRSQPLLSQMIFRHVLEKFSSGFEWSISDISDFLGDPALNTPGSQNFVFAIRSLITERTTAQHVEQMFDMLTQMFSLGAVPRSEIPLILRLVLRIRILEDPSKPATIHGLCYKKMWTGLESCAVFRPKDVGRRTLILWIHLLARCPPSGQSLSVSKAIMRLLASTGAPNHLWLPPIFLQIVKLKASRTRKTSTSAWRNFHKHIQDVSDIGRLLPAGTLFQSLFQFTESLLFSRRHRKARPEFLQIWAEALERFRHDLLFGEARWRDIQIPLNELRLSPRTRHHNLSSRRCISRKANLVRKKWLVRLWAIRILGRKARYRHHFEKRQRAFFRKLLVYNKLLRGARPKLDIPCYLYHSMQALDRLGLPNANAVFTASTGMEYERRLRKYHYLPKDVLSTLCQFERGDLASLSVSWDSENYRLLRDTMFTHWEKLASKTDITAPDFANKILLYTETKSPHRAGLLRLLRRHTPLKIALAFSWNQSNDHSFDGKLRGAPKYSSDGRPIMNPTDCLATLHSIALIFACSNKLTPRNSYRLTRWCYEFLIDHNAPLRPTMVRALYHAGIYRFQQASQPIPMERFSFIMNKIREVEGDRVAAALASGVPFEYISR